MNKPNGEFNECPNEFVLASFDNCSLTTEFAEEIALHVATCRRCGDFLTSPSREGNALSLAQIESVLGNDEVQRLADIGNRLKSGRHVSIASKDEKRPRKIGRFEVTGFLGAGSYGAVYEAVDPRLQMPVAVKLAHHANLTTHGLYSEARKVARLDHENAVRVLNAGTHEGNRDFIVFELVRGKNLKDFVGENAPSAKQLIDIFCQIAEGIRHAHEKGIIHRDIKPSNILISKDAVAKIADFGLSIDPSTNEKFKPYAGTRRFMAPEQLKGMAELICYRTDFYAIGKMLAEFRLQLAVDDFHRRIVDAIVHKCCKEKPSDRYTDARELQKDLRLLASNENDIEAAASRISVLRSVVYFGILTTLLLVVALFALSYRPTKPAEDSVPITAEILKNMEPKSVGDYSISASANSHALSELNEIRKDSDQEIELRLKALIALVRHGKLTVHQTIDQVLSSDCQMHWLAMQAIELHPDRLQLVDELRRRQREGSSNGLLCNRIAFILAFLGENDELDSVACSPNRRTSFLQNAGQWILPDGVELLLLRHSNVSDAGLALVLASIPQATVDENGPAIRDLRKQLLIVLKHRGSGAIVASAQRFFDSGSSRSLSTHGQSFFTTSTGQLMLQLDEGSDKYLSSAEVSVEQFRSLDLSIPFACDPDRKLYNIDSCPAYQISPEAAIEYCNALSVKEGRSPSYRRTGNRVVLVRGRELNVPLYEFTSSSDGYRLPTQSELRIASEMDATETYLGRNIELEEINKIWPFANVRSNEIKQCTKGIPSPRGFYHLLGNMFELCHTSEASHDFSLFGGSKESLGFSDVYERLAWEDRFHGMPQSGFRILCQNKAE